MSCSILISNSIAGDPWPYAVKSYAVQAVCRFPLLAWLDASDTNGDGSVVSSGTSVSIWKDKSGLRHDATEGGIGTGAVTRVLVETSDGKGEWNTVGVHENVIAASAMALEDAVTYGLLRQGRKPE